MESYNKLGNKKIDKFELASVIPFIVGKNFEEVLPLYQAKVDSIIADWDDIMIINGAYGPYVKGPGRRNNAKVPKEMDPKKLTRAEAEELLKNKPKATRRGVRGGRTAKKTTAKKTAKKSAKKA